MCVYEFFRKKSWWIDLIGFAVGHISQHIVYFDFIIHEAIAVAIADNYISWSPWDCCK
jgi:hypothetical protein